jgi:ribosome-binding protein aMBF1 (putative translation factor)
MPSQLAGATGTGQIDLEELLGTQPAIMPATEPARIQWDKALGKRIRLRRIQLGLSMGAVAADIGCSYQQVQKYERGRNAIKAALLPVLAETLTVPVTWFFESSDA